MQPRGIHRACLSLLLACGLTSQAAAAVRQCLPVVAVSARHATSEAEARKAALQSWIDHARLHGETFTRWQLADKRSLRCERTATGHLCLAVGAPCTISQNPKNLPSVPKKKAIET